MRVQVMYQKCSCRPIQYWLLMLIPNTNVWYIKTGLFTLTGHTPEDTKPQSSSWEQLILGKGSHADRMKLTLCACLDKDTLNGSLKQREFLLHNASDIKTTAQQCPLLNAGVTIAFALGVSQTVVPPVVYSVYNDPGLHTTCFYYVLTYKFRHICLGDL